MEVRQILTRKRRYLDLLLLADEQESMIDRYLDRGDLYVLFGEDGAAVVVAVVVCGDDGTAELKNLAVAPPYQRRGYGRLMLDHVCSRLAGRARTLFVGTGDVPSTVGFYEHCGFRCSHRLADFFLLHYDHPIVEDGVLLRDMVYLKKEL